MKISGKFVYIKKISLKDALFIYKLRIDKLNSFFLHNPPKSINAQKNWIRNNIKNKKASDFVIIEKKYNKKIGTIALNNIKKNSAEWGRWISTGNSVQNIESVVLLLKYGFKKLQLKKIYSLTNANNKKVVNFHKNSDATYNGIIKSFFNIKNKKIDAIKYSFNKENFKKFEKKFIFMTQLVRL